MSDNTDTEIAAIETEIAAIETEMTTAWMFSSQTM